MLARTLLAGAALASCSLIQAQTCTVTAPMDHEVHPVWGGETWATFSDDSGTLRIWTGEDGGRIRVSHDAGVTWEYADTPSDYTHTVFDIWFFPGGTHGFATGRGGRVLETLDGGLTWSNYGTQVLDDMSNPATLWGVRSLGPGIVLVSGLWAFQYTANSGATWNSITVYDRDPSLAGATVIPPSDLELFRLDVIDPGSTFVGTVGAKWEEPMVGDHGVILFTDSTLPQASVGRKWWVVLDDANTPASPNGAVMLEPWAVRYERGSTSTTTSVAYACGGPGGNNWSRHYRSTDSGRTWTLGGEISVTPYDVSAFLGGDAMIVGYSGRYWLRDAVTGVWTEFVMPSPSTLLPTVGQSTGALEGASTFGTQGLIATGDFGSQRISLDGGATWSSMSDYYPGSDELEQRIYDCAFQPGAPLTGCVVGQLGRILYTNDGGCNFIEATGFNSGPNLNAIDFGSASFGVAVGDGGTLTASTNGGLSWATGSFVSGTVFPVGMTAANITFRDVSCPSGNEAWAVGNFSNGTPAVAYTRNQGVDWALMPPPAGAVTLESVSFGDSIGGLVVGHSNAGGGNRAAEAYVANYTGGVLTWTDLMITLPGASTQLVSVAVSDSALALAEGAAVGPDGLVMEWTGTTLAVSSTSGSTPVNLSAVDVSPSGNTILVGGTYDTDLSTANDKGYLLRKVSGAWTSIRAHTGKDIRGISLTSDTEGYLAGQTGSGSSSFINGNLASSILLRYDAN